MIDLVPLRDRTDDASLVERAIALAEQLLTASLSDTTRRERRRSRRLGRMLADERARELIFTLTDQVLRATDPALAAQRFADAVRHHTTDAIGLFDRLLLRSGAAIAPRLPRLVMPLVTTRIKGETAGIVLPAGDPGLARHIARRAAEGFRLNVNPLGEAILSDAEATERLRRVLAEIDRADVDYVSIKASAVVANLDAFAFEASVDRLADVLRTMYRRTIGLDGAAHTFVNLDMEEYRDLELTLQAFMRVLSEHEFRHLDAGIVLQAYLPDSHAALERLGDYASERRGTGGGRVKVRLVKGANLAMESVEAELHGWTAAPYGSKADVDASYKRLLDSALRPEWADGLRIGVASHNLFDVAWALVLAEDRRAAERVEFEMLEGMAPPQARAVREAAGGVLMYAPVVDAADFSASLAYLSRRLDENTQPDNFLRALFTLEPGTTAFDDQAQQFRRAVANRFNVPTGRRRTSQVADPGVRFANAPDSDMTDPDRRAAIHHALGRVATTELPRPERIDEPSMIDRVVEAADRSARAVAADCVAERRLWLLAAADLMERERVGTIGILAGEVFKTALESDPEVSEAIDFCRYYATEGSDLLDRARDGGCSVEPRGVVVVVGPWNFPYAIPAGGVAAALAAGNSVVLKPAPEAQAVGARIADQFWRAGVPRDVLQLVVCADGPVGKRLITHELVDTVVLTGSLATATMFLDWCPGRRVLAETSGKNALVITASADIDQAIADLVRSAFGHAGQKCSAASLGILVAEVYDDPTFRRRLGDAVRSWRVGEATDPATMMGPLIAPPSGALARALTQLDPGESWLVGPQRVSDRLWTPGVRLGVQPGSWFHRTECFGPVLGLIRADDLDHAIAIQNDTDFGLTGGIHSLDDAEVERWLAGVEVGNAYVNRHITGAVVRRQPFGGWKRSVVGGGAKAGGPGYVAQFARITGAPGASTHGDGRAAMRSVWRSEFTRPSDVSHLAAESNVLRHVPLRRVAVRDAGGGSGSRELLGAIAATTGVAVDVSDPSGEADAEFAARAVAAGCDRVRLLTDLEPAALGVLHAAGIPVDREPLVALPSVELRRWVREQAISRTTHRHGRLLAAVESGLD
jgi:RHH-type proline utilization regulon transcriptional repressor/proline dehydrogenase/delta 1-pyrroline-5-carboxylate dehydrogenase